MILAYKRKLGCKRRYFSKDQHWFKFKEHRSLRCRWKEKEKENRDKEINQTAHFFKNFDLKTCNLKKYLI